MNNKGFAYIVAVMILGLLAFMGMFLLRSSTTEYSHAALSVYRTMARQLAEAAAEEAFVTLEARIKDKTEDGAMQKLLWQASNSEIPLDGGETGLNPSLLDDFVDLKNYVNQTTALKDYHMTRAGFEIETVMPSVKDLRPIDQGPLNYPDNYHHPPDRSEKFDNNYSRSWYLTLQVDVRVSVAGRPRRVVSYTVSRDIKIINQAPIARNYTMFSILGHRLAAGSSEQVIRDLYLQMNRPDERGGRLILWNQPFQSRVYLHGPAIIALENPELAQDRDAAGAYNLGDPENPRPGENHAFQYSDTFYGLSYYPTMGRAIFPPRGVWESISVWWRGGRPAIEDEDDNESFYPGVITDATVYGGLLPHRGRGFWEILGNVSQRDIQDRYFRGTNINQKFLPAGPFCRTPWRYYSPTLMREDRYLPNSTENFENATRRRFPSDDEHVRLEHRWVPDDPEIAEASRIYASAFQVNYNNVTNNIRFEQSVSHPDNLLEFSLSYYNNPDPEGFIGRLGYTLGGLGSSFWRNFTRPFQAIGALVSPLISRLFGPDDMELAGLKDSFPNLFPTNFPYNFHALATRKMTQDEFEATVRDPQTGNWVLDGVYWLDSFQIDQPVTYEGVGTIMVSRFDPDRPFKISASIVAQRDPVDGPPQGHLNIFYNPHDPNAIDVSDRLLIIEGSGNVIEASVFSCYGIRTDSGNIDNFSEIGMNPQLPMNQWDTENMFTNLAERSNVIFGNYVNFYINKHYQRGDLWVIHNIENDFFFESPEPGRYYIIQDAIDQSVENRRAYETRVHEVYMSPRIQHVGTFGASN